MSLFEKLEKVDQRVIYLLLFLLVALPLIRPLGLPIAMSPMTVAFFEGVDKIKPGSVVVVSFDYSPASSPEQYPQSKAVFHHLFAKGAKIIGVGFWADGAPFIDSAFKDVLGKSKDHPKYGIDFVNLGYIPGGEPAMASFAKDVHSTAPKDYYGNPVGELPMMKDVRSAKDFAMVIGLSSGTPGYVELLRQIQGPYGVPLCAGVTAVVGPGIRPYFPGQVFGVIEGLAGAAEYEVLLTRYGYVGTLAAPMDAQSLSHLLVIVFIALGNVGFVLRKYGKVK
jgi:hypothetical protein